MPASVVLVGVEDTENLGLRILSAYLREKGHQTQLVPLDPSTSDFSSVRRAVETAAPHIVGFSLIFQNMTPLFQQLMRELRNVTRAHFTIGGHFPSFAYEQLLAETPELDSVALFEGELTIVELADALVSGAEWKGIEGLAWRSAGGVKARRRRLAIRDLDALPWPDRRDLPAPDGPLPTASLLGSRGCPFNCTFCSISPFYRANGTPGRRLRDPADVVAEMAWLYEWGARVLLFQDDDFLGGGVKGSRWACNLASEIERRDLVGRIRFRISCRSDEVEESLLERLYKVGLSHVYLGVESGDPQHLADLDKRTTPEVHLQAAEILRRLGISFDFGYMLLTPWSTFETVRNNLSFLKELAGDGAASIGFCRTLPYAGTAVAARLTAEGRLLAGVQADYRFNDPRLDAFYDWVYEAFNHRNQHPDGTRNLLGMVLFEAGVRLPGHPLDTAHKTRLAALTANANLVLIDVIEAALDHVENHTEPLPADDPHLAWLAAHHEAQDARIRQDLAWLCSLRSDQNALTAAG